MQPKLKKFEIKNINSDKVFRYIFEKVFDVNIEIGNFKFIYLLHFFSANNDSFIINPNENGMENVFTSSVSSTYFIFRLQIVCQTLFLISGFKKPLEFHRIKIAFFNGIFNFHERWRRVIAL